MTLWVNALARVSPFEDCTTGPNLHWIWVVHCAFGGRFGLVDLLLSVYDTTGRICDTTTTLATVATLCVGVWSCVCFSRC